MAGVCPFLLPADEMLRRARGAPDYTKASAGELFACNVACLLEPGIGNGLTAEMAQLAFDAV
jgi:hypothetical protein